MLSAALPIAFYARRRAWRPAVNDEKIRHRETTVSVSRTFNSSTVELVTKGRFNS
jgi:hypothetical protein